MTVETVAATELAALRAFREGVRKTIAANYRDPFGAGLVAARAVARLLAEADALAPPDAAAVRDLLDAEAAALRSQLDIQKRHTEREAGDRVEWVRNLQRRLSDAERRLEALPSEAAF